MVVVLNNEDKDDQKLDKFDGTTLKSIWEPVALDVYKKGKLKDFPQGCRWDSLSKRPRAVLLNKL